MKIFTISIDDVSRDRLVRRACKKIRNQKSFRIATVNPEFLLKARGGSKFAQSLHSADVCVRDGFGIALAYWLRGRRAPVRVTGADLVQDFLKVAHTKKWTVYIVNRKGGLSTFREIKKSLQEEYSNIEIKGGDFENENDVPLDSLSSYTLIFCSFGAPRQEFFLQNIQNSAIPTILMGVGGSLDFLTGTQRRAPKLMRRLGLEWLFRLIQQPHRIKRIYRAVIIFPFFVILDIFRGKE